MDINETYINEVYINETYINEMNIDIYQPYINIHKNNKTNTEIDNWVNSFEKFKNFVEKNERFPKKSSNISENKLACWFLHQKYKYKKKFGTILKQPCLDLWKDFCKKHSNALDEKILFPVNSARTNQLEMEWFNLLNELDKYIIQHNRTPSETTNDIFDKKLLNWFYLQKQNCKRNTGLVVNSENCKKSWLEFIEKHKKIVLSTRYDKWFDKLNIFIKFVKENKHLPNKKSLCEKERVIHHWMIKQNLKLNRNQFNETQTKIWNHLSKNLSCRKSSLTNDKWHIRLSELKYFIFFNNRMPRNSPKYPDEKAFYEWFNKNKNNFSKKISVFRDKSFCNLWLSFIKEMKDYLPQSTFNGVDMDSIVLKSESLESVESLEDFSDQILGFEFLDNDFDENIFDDIESDLESLENEDLGFIQKKQRTV